ncbi:MAG: 5-formyltetrahydrofolate cyclo-ligase [Oscillospiraceae bacterium]|nr:5-formyltetrahydrofolate cyclo-ligase [Oscillospiraceae bacterium]
MNDNVNSAKREMRESIIKKRLELSAADVLSMSRKITANMVVCGIFDEVETVLVYKSFKNEVDTSFLIDEMITRGINVCFPRIEEVMPGHRAIVVYKIKGGDECFVRGAFGILEPNPALGYDKCELISDIEIIDLVIVPGIAYDKCFNRLGFGGGFYDKFLAHVRFDCLKVAPVFSLQIVDKVPTDQYDAPVDCLITEDVAYI